MRHARPLTALPAASIALALALAPPPTRATLGGNASSVQADGARMKAALRVQVGASYSVHVLQDSNGLTVREYAAADGTVFAVDWAGPLKPDLAALLGRYFASYAAAARGPGSDRNHMAIDTASLVVRAGGRLRSFFGRAWAPALVPAGIDPAVLP